jgi:hypothetical protein
MINYNLLYIMMVALIMVMVGIGMAKRRYRLMLE